jgi:hypothetical protein
MEGESAYQYCRVGCGREPGVAGGGCAAAPVQEQLPPAAPQPAASQACSRHVSLAPSRATVIWLGARVVHLGGAGCRRWGILAGLLWRVIPKTPKHAEGRPICSIGGVAE